MRISASTAPLEICKRFPVESIDLSFQLLRERFPSLSLILQNQLFIAKHQPENIDEGETLLKLKIEEAASIIVAISGIGEAVAEDNNASKEQLILVRSLLMDWMIYAQQSIKQS